MQNLDIAELIKIADALDSKGFVKEAEEIDNFIRMAATTAQNMAHVIQILKDTFSEAVNNQNLPYITDQSLPNIFTVLDAVGREVSVAYSQSPEQSLALFKRIEDRAIQVGEGILNLNDDIRKSEELLKDVVGDEYKQVQKEIETDKEKLRQLTIEALKWKTGKRPGDKENWEKLQALLKQRGRGL